MSKLSSRSITFSILLCISSLALAQGGGELHFAMKSDPKTLNPALVEDQASEAIRYLTGGVLIRVNRKTQENEKELAKSWKISDAGKSITFQLREGVKFSDGSDFTSDDVAATFRILMDPNVHSATGDAFRTSQGVPKVTVMGKYAIKITFPEIIAGLERLFDQVAIISATAKDKEHTVLGPFVVTELKSGQYVQLKRNANYWKKDTQGRPLPYLDGIRIDIQKNTETELLRFQRGELHMITVLQPDLFERLKKEDVNAARDMGASLENESFWFNQSPKSPMPEYKRAWFQDREFRKAVSEAINRADIARVVYMGHAVPSIGPITPANKMWFNEKLKPQVQDVTSAKKRLALAGYRLDGPTLKDKDGHAVEFSLMTNAGNKPRESMAAMIQQDLGQIGIKVNIVTLDFGSLLDRMTKTLDYEACLLGLTNVDLDPNGVMNVWLSSSDNHQWNPSEKTPATKWEAEIDKLMNEQHSTMDHGKRKKAFDRVQQIVADELPFIYLVDKNALSAVSSTVKNASPVPLRPQTFWNADTLSVK
jgi:peptide/nickel transport system substrate-binding protein